MEQTAGRERLRALFGVALPAVAVAVFAGTGCFVLPALLQAPGMRAVWLPMTLLYALAVCLLLAALGGRKAFMRLEPLTLFALLCVLALALFARMALFSGAPEEGSPLSALCPPALRAYAGAICAALGDVLLAYLLARVVSLYTCRRLLCAGAFLATLFSPELLFAGAFRGQTDALGLALGLAALLSGLTGRGRRAGALLAAALACNLRCAALLPAFALLCFARRVRPQALCVFPAALIPALAARFLLDGGSLLRWLSPLLPAPGAAAFAPNFYALLPDGMQSGQSTLLAGALFGGAAVLALLCALFRVRERLTGARLPASCFLAALLAAFFLPDMDSAAFLAPAVLGCAAFFALADMRAPDAKALRACMLAAAVCASIAAAGQAFAQEVVPLWCLAAAELAALLIAAKHLLCPRAEAHAEKGGAA